MAKRRTKEQKMKAGSRYRLPALMEVDEGSRLKPTMVKKADEDEVMSYDVGLLRKDLVKTLVVSGILMGLQIALSIYN